MYSHHYYISRNKKIKELNFTLVYTSHLNVGTNLFQNQWYDPGRLKVYYCIDHSNYLMLLVVIESIYWLYNHESSASLNQAKTPKTYVIHVFDTTLTNLHLDLYKITLIGIHALYLSNDLIIDDLTAWECSNKSTFY